MPAAPAETQRLKRHPVAQSGEVEFFIQTLPDVHQRQPIIPFLLPSFPRFQFLNVF